MKHAQKNSTLTKDQKIFYEKNGYIVIKNNVNLALIEKLRQRVIEICERKTEDYKAYIFIDPVLKKKGITGQYAVNKLQDIFYDPVLWEYADSKDVIDIVEQIIGPNITGINSMVINKPPDSDPNISRHVLHQDLHYFPCRPADKIVAAWTALERVDKRNGCLYVIPGSHEGPLYKHDYSENGRHLLYHGVQGMSHLPKRYIVMEKGDTIFFHPLLLHGSGPNFTKGFRIAISCHFADTNCTIIDVTNTTHENMAKEIENMVEKKLGDRVNFVEMFKARTRLVRGPPGKFQHFDSHL